jgi:hypothetical protein
MDSVMDPALLKTLYLPPEEDFVLVDVPDLQYVMIDGEGSPQSDAFRQARKWLFAAVFPIKKIARERMGKDFVEPPLEALWCAEDVSDFAAGRRDKMKWRLMIVTADWVDQEMFRTAVAEAGKRMGAPPESLRLERYHEGRSAQIMHAGLSGFEATVARLYDSFLPAHGLTPHLRHHQIYLNDPDRVAPGKVKTVLRQPVR